MREQHLVFSYHCFRVLVVLLFATAGFSQQTVKIVDEQGDPLIGVYLESSGGYQVSDLEGEAQLLPNIDSLFIQYLGYQDLRIAVDELIKSNYIIELKPATNLLDEIVLIGRTNAREVDLPYQVKNIKAEEISRSNASNSADALAMNSSAYVQKSQLGGGSPVLRGFEANKILLVIDGVRMNNAIYRNGHLQNAITIDPAILQQLEVIFGPGSLLYGSEALGGVIHFRTKTPLLNFDSELTHKKELNAQLRYNTADNENSIHLDYMYGTKKLGVLSSLTLTKRGDLRSGNNRRQEYPDFGKRNIFAERINGQDSIFQNPNPNIQVGTGYRQLDALQKFIYRPNKNLKGELNFQFSTSGDVPRYDNLSEIRNGVPRFSDWYYGPQKRFLASPKLTWSKPSKFYDKLILITSLQVIEESRFSRNFNNPFREAQIEDVKVLGSTFDLVKRFNLNHSLTYGLDFHYNIVSSRAFRENLDTEERREDILTRYPSGGSTLSNVGAYAQHKYQNADSTLVWINGVRYTNQTVRFSYDRSDPFQWPEYFYETIKSDNQAVIGISGLNYAFAPFRVRLASGTAFRSPNVDDLAKIRVNRDEITIPNPALSSEKVWNNELSINYQKQGINFGATAYYTRLSDAIVRVRGTLPSGEDLYFIGNDTLLVTNNVNAESAKIFGLSLQGRVQVTPELSVSQNINFQQGTIDSNEDDTPLGHIPPTYYRTKIDWEKPRYSISFIVDGNAWKPIEDYGGSVDNPDLATIDGAPSWITFGLRSQWRLNDNWSLNLNLENLTDLHYRPFSSGVSSAGRHLSVSFNYQYN